MITIIFSNAGDIDCDVIKTRLKTIPQEYVNKYIEIELDESGIGIKDDDFGTDLVDAIADESDTLLIIGHGTPYGLLSPDRREYVVWEDHFLVSHAKIIVFWWCYASDFVPKITWETGDIFSTGMFISNTEEAEMFHINTTQNDINDSNIKMYDTLIDLLTNDVPISEWLSHFKKTDDPISQFNINGMTIKN